jgi:hypothetical protein
VALDVAEALHHMHTDLGVMHSDLKARWAAGRRLKKKEGKGYALGRGLRKLTGY